MSALNLHVGPDSVTLLTDLGTYDETGTVLQIARKAWISPSLKLAMGSTGLLWVWERLQPIADSATTQGEILAALPDVLRALDCDERFRRSKHNTRIGVAFWTEEHGPMACYVGGACGDNSPKEPYKLESLQGYLQPELDDACAPCAALTTDSAIELIETQRRVRDPDKGYYCVGGGAELITIDAAGVRSEVMRLWPEDRVGEKIDPFMPAWKRTWRRRRTAHSMAANPVVSADSRVGFSHG